MKRSNYIQPDPTTLAELIGRWVLDGRIQSSQVEQVDGMVVVHLEGGAS